VNLRDWKNLKDWDIGLTQILRAMITGFSLARKQP